MHYFSVCSLVSMDREKSKYSENAVYVTRLKATVKFDRMARIRVTANYCNIMPANATGQLFLLLRYYMKVNR